jgi:hypothetical protein
MTGASPSFDRYRLGADGDDAADLRDAESQVRDGAADRRDVDANARDEAARQGDEELHDWFVRVRQQLTEVLQRSDDVTIDVDDRADVTPARLARLEAFAAEQRRLAGTDDAAVRDLLDELRRRTRYRSDERRATVRDRRDAAEDRGGAADDRRQSERDRARSAADRSQTVLEHEQVQPGDMPRGGSPSAPEHLRDRTARTVATSQQRIAAGRARRTGGRGPVGPPVPADGEGAPGPDPADG